MLNFIRAIVLSFALVISAGFLIAEDLPVFKLGHVGHDHHLALFVAADSGQKISRQCSGFWFKKQKDREVYDLMQNDTALARVLFIKVGGGSGMPSALARGEISIGLGGVAPVVAAIDQGASLKIIAPCNADGDMLMLSPDFKAKDWPGFVSLAKSRIEPLRIGYKAPRAVAYLIFRAALDTEGIAYASSVEEAKKNNAKVLLVNLQKGSNMFPSLSGKLVDGIVMNQPTVAVCESKGAGNVVCDLSALPPQGKWKAHPCCCVAATTDFLASQRKVAKGIVTLLKYTGQQASNSPATHIKIASRWTKVPEKVEANSLPTVAYVATPTEQWNKGMETWFEMINSLGVFTGSLKGKTPAEMHKAVSDYSLLDA